MTSRLRAVLPVLLLLGGTAAAFPAGTRPLTLDVARSSIGVEVRATFDSFEGRLERYESEILIDPVRPSIEQARFSFAFADLRTGRPRRDRDMLEWSESADHPVARFRLERLERTVGEPTMARGQLKLHGVEHEISFPVSFLVDGALYSIDGVVRLDYRDYGLPIIRKFLLLTVDPHLQVRFHLQGRLPSADAAAPAPASP